MQQERTAVFIVSTTDDHGPGSLREAIEQANRADSAARIDFAIGSGPATVRLSSPLPPTTFAGFIDGWSQPGFTNEPLIEISGADASSGVGLEIVGGGIVVRGLAVTGWPGDGIYAHDCDAVTLEGLHVGVACDGITVAANAGAGIHLRNANSCVIGGPGPRAVVSSGNAGFGVWVAGSADARLTGCFVGTDRRGGTAVPNGTCGVRVDGSPRTVVGGLDEGSRNVIAGNGEYGILIAGRSSGETVVTGNHIGTDATGRHAIANGAAGLLVWESPGVRIGGAVAGEGNLISGNGDYGVVIGGVPAVGTTVLGNRIGTDTTGSEAIPNGGSGIVVQSAPDARIGGPAPGEGNVVSGNTRYGIEITRPDSAGAIIVGNYVGTDASGTRAVANGRSGILVYNTPNVRIGGLGPGEGNVISGGARAGINLDGSAIVDADFAGKGNCNGNLVQGNLIGVDKTGGLPLGNELRGILIFESQDNLIVDNVISANTQDGVLILGTEDDSDPNLVPSGNRVLRNRIGITASGQPCGNGRHGVLVRHGKDNYIGGDTEDDANVIASNGARGVMFSGVGATSNHLGESNDLRDNTLGPFFQREQESRATSGRPARDP